AADSGDTTLATEPLGLRRSYAAETMRLVRSRLDVSLALFSLLMGIDVLFEHRMPGHEGVVGAYGLEILLCVVACLLTRVRRLARHTIPLAVGATSGLALIMLGYSATIAAPAEAVVIGQVCLITCLAVVLPWGVRAQLVLAAISFAGFTLLLPLFSRTTPALFSLIGLSAGVASSCVAAFLLERYRFEAFTRAAERSRAYALQEEEAEISTALL